MKKNLLLVFILLYQPCTMYAQTFILYGDTTFGGDKGEFQPTILNIGNQLIIGGHDSEGRSQRHPKRTGRTPRFRLQAPRFETSEHSPARR